MAENRSNTKQNVTISLNRKTIRKARIVAARRGTSISGLLANLLETLVSHDEAYERAERQAVQRMHHGLSLGGMHRVSRDQLHQREASRAAVDSVV
jgi:hypothetical protein